MLYADGTQYDGTWRNDARNGRGIFDWPQGSGRFEGDFRDDQMHGDGTLVWKSGATYNG